MWRAQDINKGGPLTSRLTQGMTQNEKRRFLKRNRRGRKVNYARVKYADRHQPEWLWMLRFGTGELVHVEADTLNDAVKYCGKTRLHLRRAMPVKWLTPPRMSEADKLRLRELHASHEREFDERG